MTIRKLLFLILFVGVAATLLWAADKVDGSYMVDGKTVALKYAYPVQDKVQGKPCKAILFSAAPVAPETLKGGEPFMVFSDLAQQGKTQSVEVLFKDDKTIASVRIFDKGFDGALQTGGNEKFTATKFDATGIAGKITMDKPQDFFKQTFQYNMTFDVSFPK
jgi:hypothetical protein